MIKAGTVRLHPFPGQCLDLHCDHLKRGLRNALRCGQYSLGKHVMRRTLWRIFQPQQLVRCCRERIGNSNKGGKVRFAIPADIMRIAPFAQAAPPGDLRVRDAQSSSPVPQIFAEHFHRNVLFWIGNPCYEQCVGMNAPVLFWVRLRKTDEHQR